MVHYGGHQVKIYLTESINPKYWNSATQTARNTPRFPEHPEFNERLLQIRSAINRAYLTYRNEHNGAMPPPDKFKELVAVALGKGSGPMNFKSYFRDFIDRTKNGHRINPKTKKPVKTSGVRGYETTLHHLNSFEEAWHRKLEFKNIDLEFHDDFTRFLTGDPLLLSANTVGSHIKRIKAVMADAVERRITDNTAFKSRLFIKQSEDADTIYLSVSELNELQSLDLSQSPRLENVRDLFLVGAYTGLRFSDLSNLTTRNLDNGFIKVKQAKTGQPVTIPVHKVVSEIIAKYGGAMPRALSNEKMNAYLKEIGQMSDSLKKIESKSMTKGGLQVTKQFQKWQLLTTHTARRSFATNEFLAGTPSLTIMAITGHRTEKSFLKYIRVNPEEHAARMASLWEKREKNQKLQAV